MQTERRNFPRFNLQDLKARITVEDTDHRELVTDGEVLDISYTGIKLKLDTPLTPKMESKIKIELTLPDTGIPLNISGILKHRSPTAELGLQYIDHPDQEVLDDLIFECIKR